MLDKIPTIENFYYVAIIAITTFCLTMVTAKGGLTDNRFRWWKRYTYRGKQAIALGSLIAVILFFQDVNNSNISNTKDIELINAQNSRNKAITKGINDGVEKSTHKLFVNLSLAFKKQGLQYDTIKNQVFKLRDSIRVTEISRENPLITITNLQIKDSINFDKQYLIEYSIKSLEAQSLKVDLKFDIFAITQRINIVTIYKNIRILYKGQSIGKDFGLADILKVPKDNNLYSTYVFRLKGSYYSSSNQKILIDQFYLLKPQNKKENAFTSASQVHEDFLRSYINNN